MRVIQTISDLRAALPARRTVSLVPTMGNLHDGHLSLVRLAHEHGGLVVASIFVNPLQFAPNEDFAKYPRTLERDCELLAGSGCDIVFAPDPQEIYPQAQVYAVQPPAPLADILEGSVRPGFFTGVCTVVLKLFNIVRPNIAVFGKKDYQQLLIITEMVRQLNLPIDIQAAETVREAGGLALSSRNGYLDDQQRIEAAQLHGTLLAACGEARLGRNDWPTIERAAQDYLVKRGWQPDYVAIRRRADLRVPPPADPRVPPALQSLVILGAARLGETRLIDNLEL